MLLSRSFRLALAACLAAAAPLAMAESAVKTASTALTESPLAAADARLLAAVDRAEDATFAGAETLRQREDLLTRARDLSAEASVTRRTGKSLEALIASMDAIGERLVAMADAAVVARAGDAGGSDGSAGEAEAGAGEDGKTALESPHPHAATAVIRFHATAQDALSVLGNLKDDEQSDVRQLIQAGEDVIAMIKDVGRSDAVERTKHVRSVDDITAKLQALYQTGLLDRKKGRPFLRADQVAGGYVPLGAKADDLTALRVSFVKPRTAWVFVENTSDKPRRWFVQMEFYDAQGEVTGTAQGENAAMQELKPGEVRRVEIQMTPTAPRFWDVTRGFAVYVE